MDGTVTGRTHEDDLFAWEITPGRINDMAGPNDAALWAQMLFYLRDHAGIDENDAGDRLARGLVALVRRDRGHDRTWAPGDALPDPPPRRVADLDGAVWEHQDDAGHGCYRMSEADQLDRADSIHDIAGVRPWPYLLQSEGPLTEIR